MLFKLILSGLASIYKSIDHFNYLKIHTKFFQILDFQQRYDSNGHFTVATSSSAAIDSPNLLSVCIFTKNENWRKKSKLTIAFGLS